MVRFLYSIFRWAFVLILSTILLLGAGWNVPETRDEVESIKVYVEKQLDVDLDERYDTFMKHYNRFRGIRRDGER